MDEFDADAYADGFNEAKWDEASEGIDYAKNYADNMQRGLSGTADDYALGYRTFVALFIERQMSN